VNVAALVPVRCSSRCITEEVGVGAGRHGGEEVTALDAPVSGRLRDVEDVL